MPSPAAVKLIVLLSRKIGTNLADFEAYYEQNHAPLALRIWPYISKYVRNYVREPSEMGLATSKTLATADMKRPCDVVTEMWFETEKDFQRFCETASMEEVRKKLAEDEEKFLDRTCMKMFLVREEGGRVNILT